MKVITRKEFLELDKPVLFRLAHNDGICEELRIFLKRFGENDFIIVELDQANNGTNNSDDYEDVFRKDVREGRGMRIDYGSICRDAFYDDEDEVFFAVYDEQDIDELIAVLTEIKNGKADFVEKYQQAAPSRYNSQD